MRRLAILLAGLVAAGCLAAPAAHASPVRPVVPAACTSTPAWDFQTYIGVPGHVLGDWESSNPCNFQMQTRDHCQDYHGHATDAYSGIVIAVELETRAQCPSGYYTAKSLWHYKLQSASTWSSWIQIYP